MTKNKYDLLKIQNISNFCEFDHERQKATIKVHYDSVDEIIDKKRSTINHPVVSSSVLQYIEKILEDVPDKYKVDLSLTIDEYGEYKPELIIESYKNAYYDVYSKNKAYKESANVWYIILFIVGAILICLRILGEKFNWFGTPELVSAEVIIGLIALISEVFFEEGFIFYTIGKLNNKFFNRTLHHMDSLLLCNNDGDILSRLDMKVFVKEHLKISTGYAFIRNYILFFGPVFLFMFVIQTIEELVIASTDSSVLFILYLLSILLVILVLISNLYFYLDKKPFSNFSIPVSILLFALLAVIFVLMVMQEVVSPVLFVVSILNLLGLLINILCLALQKR